MTSEALKRAVAEWREKVRATGQRTWPEWVGKSGDTKVPDKVRTRVFQLWEGICYLSGIKIRNKDWDLEHVVPLHADGENREGNLRPALKAPHKEKSKKEKTRKAKADRVAARNAGVTKSKHPIPQRPKEVKPTSKLDQIRALGGSEISRRFK